MTKSSNGEWSFTVLHSLSLKKVSVCSLSEGPVSKNCFKLGFECGEDRDWALENAPWSFKGYTSALHTWSPGIENSKSVDILTVWVQFHNLPHEYFSVDNGNLLGGKVGDVVKVEIDEEKPVEWGSFLRVLIDLNVQLPLTSGCFFDLFSGGKKWVQCKYEKIGIFCYFCGRLGHQRRGCSLSSPVMVEAVDGSLFPMFGPWLSTASRLHDVFSCAGSQAALVVSDRALLVHALGGTVVRSVSNTARGSKRGKKGTGRALSVYKRGTIQTWVPKGTTDGSVSSFTGNGIRVGLILNEGGKPAEPFPNLLCLTQETLTTVLVKPLLVLGARNGKNIMGHGSDGPGEKESKENKGLGLFNVERNVLRGGPIRSLGPDCFKASWPNIILEPLMSNGLELNVVPLDKCGPLVVNGKGHMELGGRLSLPSGPAVDRDGSLMGKNIMLATSSGKEAENNLEEKKALSQFFKAQEELLHDLKHFGKLDLYEIKNLGGDIGIPPSSETNEHTTPFKKRKFEGSASLCSRPHKLSTKKKEEDTCHSITDQWTTRIKEKFTEDTITY
ncbi:hypothetical protein G4B88_011071 [Cannabis sativa]|uniref:CCHC-type domain-containing protein n=1 Tax=Cannabis sativa TaxID=3483 RepID=A0A7J6FDC2_CANSA|nr:hypothetical protein G4B88_011071 [Cannabis sativa]